MRQKIILLILLGILSIPSLKAQEFQTEKLNEFFDTLEDNNKFMGSIGVAIDGEMVYYRGLGLCDIQNDKNPNITSKYRIGSISKTFTATLVFKAVEMGKLQLDNTLSEFFPSFPNGQEITIDQLLRHRTGIHNFTSDSLYLTYNTQPKDRKEMLRIITSHPLDFEPDSQFAYSNSNYVLLSYILEDIFELPYSTILEKLITKPLKLNDTTIANVIQADKNECNSYELINSTDYSISTVTDASIAMGAGGISSSTEDLLKFGNALFSEKIISKTSLDQMMDFEESMGRGIFRVPFYDTTGYGHTGGIDEFTSAMFYFPSKKLTYVLLSNGSNYNNNQINIAVLSAAYDKPIKIPDFTIYEIEETLLPKFTGNFTSKDLPLEIEIFLDQGVLYAQATGQASFPLFGINDFTLKNDVVGIVFKFDKDYTSFVLEQGGSTFNYMRIED